MKVLLAAFQAKSGGFSFLDVDIDTGVSWADQNENYVRVTQNVEIEFPDLEREEIVKARLKTLEAYEEKVTRMFHVSLAEIKDQREKLLALPNHVMATAS